MFNLAIEVCFENHFGLIHAIILLLGSTKSVLHSFRLIALLGGGGSICEDQHGMEIFQQQSGRIEPLFNERFPIVNHLDEL